MRTSISPNLGFVVTYLCACVCVCGFNVGQVLKRVRSVLYNRPIIEMDKVYIKPDLKGDNHSYQAFVIRYCTAKSKLKVSL